MSDVYNPSGIKLEVDYIADTIFHSPPPVNTSSMFIIIRIFGGGNSNLQLMQLKSAIQELNIDQRLYIIETLTCDDVNVNHYSIKEIVDWLQAATVHFITGHVHQGLQLAILDSKLNTAGRFTMTSILSELQRLKFHRGFPYGNFLQCPVFLQDKYEYLAILKKHGMCNPTLKIDRHNWFTCEGTSALEAEKPTILSTIYEFLANCNEEGCGWVVKLPFVTNQIVKGIKSKDEVIKKLTSVFNNDSRGIYPYAMIQPCMKNRKEYKVVYIPAKNIIYITSTKVSNGHNKQAFPTGENHSDLFDFVKRAVAVFQDECPHSICDGLFRVDVFMNQANEYIVNEFESLEASYYGRPKFENAVTHFLKEYWSGKLKNVDLIRQLIDRSAEMRSKEFTTETSSRKQNKRNVACMEK